MILSDEIVLIITLSCENLWPFLTAGGDGGSSAVEIGDEPGTIEIKKASPAFPSFNETPYLPEMHQKIRS
jgi:hypothetical protein